jgi:stearoyl-CoA desaturase (delta-9 desaturase)
MSEAVEKETSNLSKRHKPRDERIEFWGNLPFVIMHLGCLLVFWVGVTPTALIIAFFCLTIRMFGLTGGYHRYFSHRSYETSRTFQFILAFLGACSLQKDPIWWAAHHRQHHRFADTEKDAHSPVANSFFWSHMGWFMTKKNANMESYSLVPDLAKYPELRFLHGNQKLPAFFMLALLFGVGAIVQYAFPQLNTTMGQVVVWSFFVSTIVLHHCTFCVNSFSHIFGTKRFKLKNEARNNWVVAFLTMGEGWHNNHHRYPSSERQGFYWWEFDVTHYILVVLSWFGIVWNLRKPPKEIYDEGKNDQGFFSNV